MVSRCWIIFGHINHNLLLHSPVAGVDWTKVDVSSIDIHCWTRNGESSMRRRTGSIWRCVGHWAIRRAHTIRIIFTSRDSHVNTCLSALGHSDLSLIRVSSNDLFSLTDTHATDVRVSSIASNIVPAPIVRIVNVNTLFTRAVSIRFSRAPITVSVTACTFYIVGSIVGPMMSSARSRASHSSIKYFWLAVN